MSLPDSKADGEAFPRRVPVVPIESIKLTGLCWLQKNCFRAARSVRERPQSCRKLGIRRTDSIAPEGRFQVSSCVFPLPLQPRRWTALRILNFLQHQHRLVPLHCVRNVPGSNLSGMSPVRTNSLSRGLPQNKSAPHTQIIQSLVSYLFSLFSPSLPIITPSKRILVT
jgi:hypothetical protein